MKEYKINNKNYRLNIFEKVNTNEAYLLGYLLGDGGYHKKTHKRKDRLFVSSIERNIINFFQETYCPDTTIHSKIPVNKKRNIKSKTESHVLVFSSKFSEIFNKHGLLTLKEERTYHNIPKEEFDAFLLGLFDSDGSFSWGKRRDRNRLWGQIKITHPNLKMLTKLQKDIADKYNISTFITPKKGENCYVLQVSGLQKVYNLLEIMYNNKPKQFNNYKFNNWELFKQAFLMPPNRVKTGNE